MMSQSDSALCGSQLDEITGALETLIGILDREENPDVVLQRVCGQVVQAVPGVDMASMTLLHDGQPETVAGTNDLVYEVDRRQYESGQGPCLQAAATGQVVRLDLLAAASRWPEFTAAAQAAGVGSYLSVPLVIDREHSGAMNLYGYQEHGYREVEVGLLEVFTTAVEAAFRSAYRYRDAQETIGQLRKGLVPRAEIDQARGILMGAERVSADEAFALLIARSQRENIKLRDVAQHLITGVVSSPS